jgi:hypothetical protein
VFVLTALPSAHSQSRCGIAKVQEGERVSEIDTKLDCLSKERDAIAADKDKLAAENQRLTAENARLTAALQTPVWTATTGHYFR